MKQSKKYVILHIETGEYVKTNGLKVEWNCISVQLPDTFWNASISMEELSAASIVRTDFSLKRNAIYFKDKVSAITFLRDIFLPKTNNSWYCKQKYIRRYHRNEFEIIEV